MDVLDAGVGFSLARIVRELDSTVEQVVSGQAFELSRIAEHIVAAPRVFVVGAGRSGLALRMTAMRLMHLGIATHVVGEVTTPAIAAGDLLLAASGSGTTAGVVRAAQTALRAGARVVALTTAAESPLGRLAADTVVVPAADKLDWSGEASAQYAGSLFEQTVVLLGDAFFHAVWQRSGMSAEALWPRHANLE